MGNSSIELQHTSNSIWESKYQLKDMQGGIIDKSIDDTFDRVATALAECENDPDKWKEKFKWALEKGATPAGRIISNAGAQEFKPATSTINCVVSGTINDSMDNILYKLYEAGNTLKAGCGIGYEFSTIRPVGAFVKGAGAYTSGALSFADIYDKMCFAVASAGGRRGAQMMTFCVHHPDIEQFITAKREDGRFRQFNLSILITDEFVKAVKRDLDWKLSFPVNEEWQVSGCESLYRKFPAQDGYIENDKGEVLCKVYKTLKARDLWDLIMKSTYDFAEPGFILIDSVNKYNPLHFCEDIRATNPCGEQPLAPYGSCLLGSINLSKLVIDPFTQRSQFDMSTFIKLIRVFTRMLDNVISIHGLPLEKQVAELIRKRRHGLGYLGLGSMFSMLGIAYGSNESIKLVNEITRTLAIESFKMGVELAKEKGCAPIFNEMGVREKYVDSPYFSRLAAFEPKLRTDILENGCRFTHATSIAPTGTIALSLGNNCSNGIEPTFAHHFSRNVIVAGKKSKEKVDVFSYELLMYRNIVDSNAMPDDLPDYFSVCDTVTPEQHVDIQAAAQYWIDSSISKTINVPTGIGYDEFKDIYMYAYDNGLKGCTTFRFNPEAFQGVLVKEVDLKNTTYQFTLESGEVVTATGEQIIQYDDEYHNAANLYDAIKENYFGKL